MYVSGEIANTPSNDNIYFQDHFVYVKQSIPTNKFPLVKTEKKKNTFNY